ncbi:MAG: beta-1,6-N-acetylglucosaminyltransferase [Rhodobacteraceae bacterium]|nr:beta-1,6-N-acetylglucosaminyltransferase [Paracoccaceae bacterium]
MSVGIALLLHQDFDRAAELTQALLREGCKIAVHIDAKTPTGEMADYAKTFEDHPNLTLTNRIKCEWGMFSLVQAQLIAAKALLDGFADVTHVVQLSGSCLPTRPIAELKRFLAKNHGTDFIESVVAGQKNWIKGGLEAERFSLYFPFAWRKQRILFDGFVKIQRKLKINRDMPAGLEPHLGSQWWALCRETLTAILKDPKRRENDRFFSKCWIPDESYFQTLVRKHAKRIESRSLTFSRFDQQGNPMMFYNDHLEYLEHLEGFFVRKVWREAHMLYETLLSPDYTSGQRDREMRLAFAAQTERLEGRRNRGRVGLSMQSRVLKHRNNRSETAAPYSVLLGFDKTFLEIDSWLSEQINQPVHGDLFAIGHAEMAKNARLSKGNLTGHGKIRDYAPLDFLTNLVWNNRNDPITFQFWSVKKQRIFQFMANDANANIHYIRYAWVPALMQENITNMAVLKLRVAGLMEMDRQRINALSAGFANFKIYALADVLAKPATILYGLIEELAPKTETIPRILPKTVDWQGLEKFTNLLKNNGMNINLELAENARPEWHDDQSKPILIAE